MKCACSRFVIEHREGDKEVVLRLICDTSYETAVLYDALTEGANKGSLVLNLETQNVKEST